MTPELKTRVAVFFKNPVIRGIGFVILAGPFPIVTGILGMLVTRSEDMEGLSWIGGLLAVFLGSTFVAFLPLHFGWRVLIWCLYVFLMILILAYCGMSIFCMKFGACL